MRRCKSSSASKTSKQRTFRTDFHYRHPQGTHRKCRKKHHRGKQNFRNKINPAFKAGLFFSFFKKNKKKDF